MLSVLFLSLTLWLSWDIDVYPSFLQIIIYIMTTRPNGIKKAGTVITNCMIDETPAIGKCLENLTLELSIGVRTHVCGFSLVVS